jgi:hypothetical protein
MAQPSLNLFWSGISLAIFAGVNFAAYRARKKKTWTDVNPPPFIGFAIVLLIATPMFGVNVPPSLTFIGLILLFGTIAHAAYCWFQCWPSTIQRESDSRKRAETAEQDRKYNEWREQYQSQQQAEVARRSAALEAITVGRDGITNIAKQIVAELARADA